MLQIYKASAGSGKTYTLTREYIRTLLGIRKGGDGEYVLNHPKYTAGMADTVNRHRHILAITFTNKATEEMKRRIITELDDLANRRPVTRPDGTVDDASYANLTTDLHCTRDELAEAAQTAMRQLLYDYQNFNVSTIDSFFQRVLRTFARELDHQGDYLVEIDSDSAIRQALDNMMDEFNLGMEGDKETESSLFDWIYNYIVDLNRQGQKTNFFNRSSSLYRKLAGQMSKISEERFKDYYEKMRLYLADRSRLTRFGKALEDHAAGQLEELARKTRAHLDRLEAMGFDLPYLGKSVLKRLIASALACELPKSKKDYRNDAPLLEIAEGEKIPFSTKQYPGRTDWASELQEMAQEMAAVWKTNNVFVKIKESLPQLVMLSFAWNYIDRYMAENNTVLLSDTNHLLSRVINDDDTPFIYERMGVRLRHFLIDEFQDTSLLQWKNLRPLVANGLAGGNDSLIIGDVKQSIYRFRSSDPDLLDSTVETKHFPGARIRGAIPEENTNYRSSADIVRFNNKLFSALADMNGVSGYGQVEQGVAPGNLHYAGYIHFSPVSSKKEHDETTFGAMAREMLRQHDEGGYDWGQITVLVRTNDEGCRVVDFLMNHYPQIPLMSEESLQLKKSPAVQSVLGTLRLIEQAGCGVQIDDSRGRINLTPADLSVVESRYLYYTNAGLEPWEALDRTIDKGLGAQGEIQGLMERVNRSRPSTLVALVETVINELDPAVKEDQTAFLAAFQDLVSEYCAHKTPALSAFLHYWEVVKDKATIPASVDVRKVRIMTIHKSKGLEFKCVHIPLGSWNFPGGLKDMWLPLGTLGAIPTEICPPAVYLAPDEYCVEGAPFHEEYERELKALKGDTLNITYVAYTRAEAELCVWYDPEKGIGKNLKAAFDRIADHEWLSDIPGEITVGAPTRCTAKTGDKTQTGNVTRISRTMAEYKVETEGKDQVLFRLTDALGLEPDVEDDDEAGAEAGAGEYGDEESRRRGLAMHDVLSQVATPADIPAAVAAAARRHGLGPEEAGELERVAGAMLADVSGPAGRWFGPGVDAVCEQSIYDPRSGCVRRPDRVVFLPDGTVEVVDYKFTSGATDGHAAQVRGYVELLEEMGYRATGYLWYPLLPGRNIHRV